jgi:oligopeptide transport system substrate-binding protein
MTAGDFDMVASAWGPDYDDPLTYADLFASWNMNNRGRYHNPEYDRMVAIAQRSIDPPARNTAFARIQDIVIEDAVIIPLYERGYLYVQHPRLRGVKRRVFGGDPNYMYAHIGK